MPRQKFMVVLRSGCTHFKPLIKHEDKYQNKYILNIFQQSKLSSDLIVQRAIKSALKAPVAQPKTIRLVMVSFPEPSSIHFRFQFLVIVFQNR